MENKSSILANKLLKKILKVSEKLSVDEWADKYRVLSTEGASEPGKWDTNRTPYMKEIYKAIAQKNVREIVLMMASQLAKTETLLNTIGRYMHLEPGPIIVMQPDDEAAKSFSVERVAPMIRDTPVLTPLLKKNSTKNSGNNIKHKIFPGGFIAFVGSRSPTKLASRPARIVLCDEVDRYKKSSGKEGSPLELIKKRVQTFSDSKILITGTPTVKNYSAIETEYLNSSMGIYKLRCPHCETYNELKFNKLVWENQGDKIINAKMTCDECGVASTENEWKRRNQETGKWFHKFKLRDEIIGFHLNGLAGIFMSWERLIKAWIDAEVDPEKKKAFINTVMAETYEDEYEERLDEDILFKRREEYGAELPEGALILTAGIDTQDNRFAIEVIAHGLNGETWGIEYKTIYGNLEEEKPWLELDEFLSRRFEFRNGDGLYIYSSCIDTGGHHTQAVYDYVSPRQEYKRIYGVKGQGGETIPSLNGFRLTKCKKIDLLALGVNSLKDINYGRLKVKNRGAKYCHFPSDVFKNYDIDYFRELTAEVKIIRHGKVIWKKLRKRNEALDCRNYAIASLLIFGFDFEELNKLQRKELEELSLNGKLIKKTIKRRISKGVDDY